ncbi:hypothetical protein AGABI1DRAFT_128200 [Agaricus bisporus var. burnettii JB137-S8]|uniref:Uncharacterized protein n=1 Tax=Agaricus bisporus var. burnettii (strain JB137-S8 / ATCC MYA-4627 / FGSC 10392) TaxID=597362 RepID=K5XB77_AGABU|nr:uncharacterized protein AGABI1DRAFT_128200 [Agaricus bisporus var. burnettii JB137-S8]EKM80523.1 hypothetical protein AGABI1DRAFT_128200 [Agaricus bisporus var. burnettii JB137-S8]
MTSAFYESRAKSKTFPDLIQRFSDCNPHEAFMLGEMTYRETFEPFQTTGDPTREDSFVRTGYRDISTKEELAVILFGEVAPSSSGTMISAKGNYFTANAITDQNAVKDVLVLRCPIGCEDTLLSQFFMNQLSTLEEIIECDASADPHFKDTYNITSFLVPPQFGTYDILRMRITLPKKYEVPRSVTGTQGGGTSLPLPKKRRIATASSSSHPSSEERVNASTTGKDSPHLGSPSFASPPSLKSAGEYYPPSALPDYGGDHFRLNKAMLVQQNITGIDGKTLIPPWDMWDKLRPGTIVFVDATLVCWTIPPRRDARVPKSKKVYQIQANAIRVVCESEDDAERSAELKLSDENRPAPIASSSKKSSSSFVAFNQKSTEEASMGS